MKGFKFLPLALILFLISACSSEPVKQGGGSTRPAIDPHVFPDAIFRQFANVARSNRSSEDKVAEMQNIFCNRSKARFLVIKRFKYYPPNTRGLALDDAAEWKKTHLDETRQFLKNRYYYQSGTVEFLLSSEDDREAFVDNADALAYNLRNGIEGDRKLEESIQARFLPINRPIDLNFLIETSTLRIPLEVVAHLKGMKGYTTDTFKNSIDTQYLGYDGNVFSAKLAVQHRDYLWRWAAANSTTLAEDASSSDGVVNFQITLDLGRLYCPYGLPLTSLISH